MDIRLNDILTMKKAHPCGAKDWLVLRIGADFRLRCLKFYDHTTVCSQNCSLLKQKSAPFLLFHTCDEVFWVDFCF